MTTLQSIAAIVGGVGALFGFITVLYRTFWSPKAKARRQALVDGKQAIKNGDASKITSAFDKLRIIVFVLIFFAGCSSPVILHPIEQSDIMRVKADEWLMAPKDGYFISDLYLEQVMEAKVK